MSNQNALFEITTRMDKEDYRKFSYMTIFRKKAQTVMLIIILAGVGAGLAAMMEGSFSLQKFLLIWLILIPTAFAAIVLRVEYKAYKKMSLVRSGLASLKQYITFYENYLIAEEGQNSSKIKYDKLYRIIETDDYYIIYANESSASMIRKRDVDSDYQDEFRRFLITKLGNRYKTGKGIPD